MSLTALRVIPVASEQQLPTKRQQGPDIDIKREPP